MTGKFNKKKNQNRHNPPDNEICVRCHQPYLNHKHTGMERCPDLIAHFRSKKYPLP